MTLSAERQPAPALSVRCLAALIRRRNAMHFLKSLDLVLSNTVTLLPFIIIVFNLLHAKDKCLNV